MSVSKRSKTRPNHVDAFPSLESIATRQETALSTKVLSELLAKSLAAYVIQRSREPISEVMSGLFDIELEAADLVGSYYSDPEHGTNLRGALASVFSFVPIGRKLGMGVKPRTAKARSYRSASAKTKAHVQKEKTV